MLNFVDWVRIKVLRFFNSHKEHRGRLPLKENTACLSLSGFPLCRLAW
jgi:hypothetical protein